jgi:GAF domain-containing protein/HAMP domain-containing protein
MNEIGGFDMTTLNPSSPKPPKKQQGNAGGAQAAEITTQARDAFRVAVIMLGVAIVNLSVNLYLAFQSGARQLFVLVGAVFAHGIASLVSIMLIRRGRPGLAVWLLIGALLVVVPIGPLVVVGLGLVLGAALVAVTAAIAGQMLPPRQAGWAVAASVVVGFGMLLLDQLGPDYRLSVPQLQVFFPAVSVVAVLVFGYFVARQFRDYTMRAKMLITFVAVAAIAVVGVSFMTLRSMRSAFTEQIGESYTVEAESLGRLVGSFFKARVSQVVALTTIDGIKDQLEERNQSYTGSSAAILAEIQALDEQWVAAGDDDPFIRGIITPDLAVNPTAVQLECYLETFPSHTEIFVTDRYGATLGATGRLSDYYQADEGWWQAAWNDGEGAIYISDPEYDESAGVTALLIAVPVFDEETGKVIGIVRSTLNVESLFAQIGAVKYGETGHAVLFDGSAEVLYEPVEEGKKSSAELPLDMRQHLISMEHYMVATDAEGHQSIFAHSPIVVVAGKDVYETEAALAAAVSNLNWAVAVRQETEEAFAPIMRLTQNVQLVGAVILVLAGLGALFLAQIITRPLLALTTAADAMGAGDLDAPLPPASGDEVGSLTTSFGDMAAQLGDLISTLEQRVADRTRDLEQRSAYLAAAAEVGRAVASILDMEALIQQVVDLIKNRFDLYYVGLFLVDEAGEWAVLRAGTGQAGRVMLAREHRIKVGEGMIGWSIANAEARVALDVGEDAVRFVNPDLPDTRSEGALPLRSRGRVLGALTVQSSEEAAFDQDTIVVLQTMADQVAVALDNADLFTQSQAALEAERRAYGEISREAWAQMVRTRPDLGYLCNPQGIHAVESQLRPEMVQASQAGQAVQADGPTVAIPIKVRDHVAGVVRLRKSDDAGEWTAEEVALMETLTDQLGVALESARHYQDTQRRAARERLTSQVTARIRETLDMETVLKTAVQEVRQALGLPEVVIRLAPQPAGEAGDGVEQSEA